MLYNLCLKVRRLTHRAIAMNMPLNALSVESNYSKQSLPKVKMSTATSSL